MSYDGGYCRTCGTFGLGYGSCPNCGGLTWRSADTPEQKKAKEAFLARQQERMLERARGGDYSYERFIISGEGESERGE